LKLKFKILTITVSVVNKKGVDKRTKMKKISLFSAIDSM
jgi:hypothetical protein